MKTLNIGDKIKINSNPVTWSSGFSSNNPLEANFEYPVIGIIKNKKDGFGYIGLLVEINGEDYGFSEETLLEVCEKINYKELYQIKESLEFNLKHIKKHLNN